MTKLLLKTLCAGAAFALAACSSGSHSMLPSTTQSHERAASSGAGNGVSAPVASPANLQFTSIGSGSAQTFTVTVQFAGDLTAVSSNAGVATVSPSTASPSVTATGGGTKSATFTVTPTGGGNATITVTDKKGATASVSVSVVLAYPNGTLFVADENLQGPSDILQFAPGKSGNIAPVSTIALPMTVRGSDSSDKMAFDSQGNIYDVFFGGLTFAGDFTVGISEFSSTGGSTPVRTIAGPHTGLQWPDGIAIDSAGYIYVADRNNDFISVFAPGASGDVAPVRTISGPDTLLTQPAKLLVDPNGYLYVANANRNVGNGVWGPGGISVFAPGASGDAAPVRRFGAEDVSMPNSAALGDWTTMAFDRNGNLYASDGADVYEFPANASGVTKPLAHFWNSCTIGQGYSFPQNCMYVSTGDLAVDPQGYVYVLQYIGNSTQGTGVQIFAPNSNGGVLPLAQISGSQTTMDVFSMGSILVWNGSESYWQN